MPSDTSFYSDKITNKQLSELIERIDSIPNDIPKIKCTFTYRCVCGKLEFELPKLEKFNIQCVYCGRKYTGLKAFGNGLNIIEYEVMVDSLFHRVIRWIDSLFR